MLLDGGQKRRARNSSETAGCSFESRLASFSTVSGMSVSTGGSVSPPGLWWSF